MRARAAPGAPPARGVTSSTPTRRAQRARRVLRVREERQVVRLGAVERRDRRHDRAVASPCERAAHRRRNGVGGEGPRALTADVTRRWSRSPPPVTGSRRRARHAGRRRRGGARPRRRRRGRRRALQLGQHAIRHVEVLVHRDDRRALIGVEDHRVAALDAHVLDRRLDLVEDRLHELVLAPLRLLLELRVRRWYSGLLAPGSPCPAPRAWPAVSVACRFWNAATIALSESLIRLIWSR